MAKIETQNSDSPLKTWISPLSHFAPLISQNFQTPLVFLGLKNRVSPLLKGGRGNYESPKKYSWPNMNKPGTGEFDRTISQKWHFLGSGSFLKDWSGHKPQNFRKIEIWVQGHLSGVPKKLIWPNLNKLATRYYVTKIALFGTFWAIFREFVWASDWKFRRNYQNVSVYFSRVSKKPYTVKF